MDKLDEVLKEIDLEDLREVRDRVIETGKSFNYRKHLGRLYDGDIFIRVEFRPERMGLSKESKDS